MAPITPLASAIEIRDASPAQSITFAIRYFANQRRFIRFHEEVCGGDRRRDGVSESRIHRARKIPLNTRY